MNQLIHDIKWIFRNKYDRFGKFVFIIKNYKMKRDIIYIILIIWLIVLLEASNKIFSIEYQKGYNTRQVEIMDAIKEADGWCSDAIERGKGTTGYVIDSKITLVDFTLEENRFNERIVYKCKKAYGTDIGSSYPKFGWSADPIWIGNSRCDCIDFNRFNKN